MIISIEEDSKSDQFIHIETYKKTVRVPKTDMVLLQRNLKDIEKCLNKRKSRLEKDKLIGKYRDYAEFTSSRLMEYKKISIKHQEGEAFFEDRSDEFNLLVGVKNHSTYLLSFSWDFDDLENLIFDQNSLVKIFKQNSK